TSNLVSALESASSCPGGKTTTIVICIHVPGGCAHTELLHPATFHLRSTMQLIFLTYSFVGENRHPSVYTTLTLSDKQTGNYNNTYHHIM
ncbi:hypothetical protein RYX36_025068, partial [Vicia faba]